MNNKDMAFPIGIMMMLIILCSGIICGLIDNRFYKVEHQLSIITNAEDCIEIEDLNMIVCKKSERNRKWKRKQIKIWN